MTDLETASPIGRRIQILGNTGSGKSTLAARLAQVLDAAFVELDALNWEPGWVGVHDRDPQELERRFHAATRGERWVVAGSYMSHSQRCFWERLQTIVWLDLPMPLLLWRVLRRTWQRWRSKELLWGTNLERFWPQFMIWRNDSLLTWLVTGHARKRNHTLGLQTNPRWSHVRFVRLTSPAPHGPPGAGAAAPNFQMLSAVLANSHSLSSALRNAMWRRNRSSPAR